jgi:hypothetical protein
MKISISQVKHKNVDAVLMESDLLSLTVIPESGAKIQSIYDKRAQKELLYQSSRDVFRKVNYGARFDSGDFSGFDEVFPTIDECFYPSGPWLSTPVPDHGEVWVLPWDYQIAENSVTLSVHGVRFPYRIEKKVEFLRENCFRLSYQALNLSDFDFDFIWCPHPFFVCDENTRVVLPPSVKEVISTCSLENKLGDYGSIHPWPVTRTSEGELYDISDVMHPPYAGKCEKFYAVNRPNEGWCALQNIVSGETIGLSYPIDKLPYLGVWEGIIDNQYVTALEPVTGALDRLDVSRLAGKVGVIKARSKYEWLLNITIDRVDEIKDIDQEGYVK